MTAPAHKLPSQNNPHLWSHSPSNFTSKERDEEAAYRAGQWTVTRPRGKNQMKTRTN